MAEAATCRNQVSARNSAMSSDDGTCACCVCVFVCVRDGVCMFV